MRACPHQSKPYSFSFSPLHSQPWAGDPAVAAPGATARRVQRVARKNEITCFTTRRVHSEALTICTYGSLDMLEIILERTYRQPKLVAQFIKAPLLSAQELDNLLPAGAIG